MVVMWQLDGGHQYLCFIEQGKINYAFDYTGAYFTSSNVMSNISVE